MQNRNTKRILFALAALLLTALVVFIAFSGRPAQNHGGDDATVSAAPSDPLVELQVAEPQELIHAVASPLKTFYQYDVARIGDFEVSREDGEAVLIQGFNESCEETVLISDTEQTVYLYTDVGILPCEVTAVPVSRFYPRVNAYRVQAGN